MTQTQTQTLFISAFRAPRDSDFAAMASWDHYKIHQMLCSGFADRYAAIDARILFRLDFEGDAAYLCAQTKLQPDWSRVQPGADVTITGPAPLRLPELVAGGRLQFRLLARPSMRIAAKDNPKSGKRIALISDADQRAWLDRKGAASGFTVEDCVITQRTWHDAKAGHTMDNGAQKTLAGALFNGTLRVDDPAKLQEAVANGIGIQKAYGFGLLSLAAL